MAASSLVLSLLIPRLNLAPALVVRAMGWYWIRNYGIPNIPKLEHQRFVSIRPNQKHNMHFDGFPDRTRNYAQNNGELFEL